MIEFVRIRRLGIIDEAELEIGPGLTVLTGETGAGKTMVLSALNLLLGGKSIPGLATAADTTVQGGWQVNSDAVRQRLSEAAVELADDELLVTRTLPNEGRSRCSVNGVAVPLAVLGDLSDDLVTVHGQSEQTLLRKPAKQRAALDRFGGSEVAALSQQYTQAYERVRELDEQVRAARENQDSQAAELAQLIAALEEIERVDPKPGEDETLAAQAERLTNLTVLREAAGSATSIVVGDDSDSSTGVVERTDQARKVVESVVAVDESLQPLVQQLADAVATLSELGRDLRGYLDDLEIDPSELEQVQSRRAAIKELTRKYGGTVDEVLEFSRRSAQRVDQLRAASNLEELTKLRDEARSQLGDYALTLSEQRQAAGKQLAAKVTAELAGLAMPHTQLIIEIRQHPLADEVQGLQLPGGRERVAFGASGIDEVRFMMIAHKGATPTPVGDTASGGELSRIMLALEVVLAHTATADTFVFDEVDAGVGGKAAVEIGRRLARLSRNAQVLVVTHLPQVAAFADQHFVVSKLSDGRVTESSITKIDQTQRIKEIARMLAGQEDSEHAMAHAAELLEIAELEWLNHPEG